MESLHPRIQLLWALGAAIFAGVIGGIGLLIGRFLVPVDIRLVAGIAIGLALLGIVHTVLRYRIWRFDLEADALYLERGVFTRVETAVPYVRVQHIDTHRGPLERLAGLSSVVVYTAGSRGADVTIPGLVPDRARQLRDQLRDLAIESEPSDAV